MSNVSMIDGHIDGMTEEQIIKALEEFHHRILKTNLSYHIRESEIMAIVNILALINRKNAEIERLQSTNNRLKEDIEHILDDRTNKIEKAKFEAIKEFVKKFEKNIKDIKVTLGQTWEIQNALCRTKKEMVGDTE